MNRTKERNHDVDITKSILIYLVVVGHYFTNNIHTYIFWFHMPAFIMISGLFINDKISLKEELIKKGRRLLVPYFFFSITIGTLGSGKSFAQQIMGTFWGANNNATPCTYPYYFVTQLFVAFIILNIIQYWARKINKGAGFVIGIAVSLYTLMQLLVSLCPTKIWEQIPWNMDMALVSVCFLCVGKYMKKYIISHRGGYIAMVVVILLLLLQTVGFINYNYNFLEHNWHWGLDILIPYVFLIAVLVISNRFDMIPGINNILRYIGKASLFILFLHPFFQKVNGHFLEALNINFWLMALLCVFECIVCYWVLMQNKYLKWIIGEK